MACCSRSWTVGTGIRTGLFRDFVTPEEVPPWEDPAPFEAAESRLVCIVAAGGTGDMCERYIIRRDRREGNRKKAKGK
jgi:hypothetical protein